MSADPDVAQTLDDVVEYNERFVVLSEHQHVAVSLWDFHTYAVDAADSTPYLSITSALPRSGKSRQLEVLELLAKQPLPTANISDAALFRAIDELSPTLLFDEIDSVFGPKAREREDLRGMLNAGYRRGAVCYRMGGANNRKLEAFAVFCAKAFAGIGELPPTLRDRSIRIKLERRVRNEPIQRFRRRDAEPDADLIRQSIAALADHHLGRLSEARPELPDTLDDRAQDVWEPLLAIADLAGGDWPALARKAAVVLSSDAAREDDSFSALLLRDLHTVFSGGKPVDKEKSYKTADLIAELALIEESPWGDWYGKLITAQGIGKLLKPFQIKTMSLWDGIGSGSFRGYKAEQFTDVWKRVLGVEDPAALTLTENEKCEEIPSVDAGSVALAPFNGDTRETAQISAVDAAMEGSSTSVRGQQGVGTVSQSQIPITKPAALLPSGEWLARDGVWRPLESSPPAFPGEVVATRERSDDAEVTWAEAEEAAAELTRRDQKHAHSAEEVIAEALERRKAAS